MHQEHTYVRIIEHLSTNIRTLNVLKFEPILKCSNNRALNGRGQKWKICETSPFKKNPTKSMKPPRPMQRKFEHFKINFNFTYITLH